VCAGAVLALKDVQPPGGIAVSFTPKVFANFVRDSLGRTMYSYIMLNTTQTGSDHLKDA